jgi:hypothetical protein
MDEVIHLALTKPVQKTKSERSRAKSKSSKKNN